MQKKASIRAWSLIKSSQSPVFSKEHVLISQTAQPVASEVTCRMWEKDGDNSEEGAEMDKNVFCSLTPICALICPPHPEI